MQTKTAEAVMESLKRGLAAHQAGDLDQAERHYQSVLAADRHQFDALYFLGVLQGQRGNLNEAAQHLGRALERNAQRPDVQAYYASILNDLTHHAEALAAAERALSIDLQQVEAWVQRGLALRHLGRREEALTSFDRALALRPNLVAVMDYVAVVMLEMQRPSHALAASRRALAIDPAFRPSLMTAARAFYMLGRYAEAHDHFERVLKIAPDDMDALGGAGDTLLSLGRPAEALDRLGRLLQIAPDFSYARGLRAHAAAQLADWRHMEEDRAAVAENLAARRLVSGPFEALGLIDDAAAQRTCAEIGVAMAAPAAVEPLWRGERYDHDRIRVAYVSADFGEHAVARVIVGALERHDRARFEIIGVSLMEHPPNEFTERVQAAFDRFVPVQDLDVRAIAAKMREMEIDIAVDLMGHTQFSRLGIFAQRPAPIQVNYLGYSGTTGAGYIDYIVGDPWVIPEGHESGYAEKVARLPDSYFPSDPARPVAETTPRRAEHGLPEQGFVFCCFNRSWKIMPEVFEVWMRLLKAVEGSVLWLAARNETAVSNLRQAARERGVDAERLVFASRVPSTADHLARHRLADLFLDTLPYGAHTTAGDALWAGLPVLTCLGNAFASRVGGSLLDAVGLPELIAGSLADYEALALKLARDPALLASFRERLAHNRLTMPLFDTDRTCRHLEAAYLTMLERHRRGEPPASFSVPPVAGIA